MGLKKAKKATKRFIKSHLPRTIKQRRIGKKFAGKRKRDGDVNDADNKESKADANADAVDDGSSPSKRTKLSPRTSATAKPTAATAAAMETLNVQEFLNTAILDDADDDDDDVLPDDDDDGDNDPDILITDRSGKSRMRTHAEAENTTADDVDEDDDGNGVDGKEGDDDDDDDADDDNEEATQRDDDAADDNDNDDEIDGDESSLLKQIARHEQELAQLAKSDPEFYKHLQQDEPELLSFNKEQVLGETNGADTGNGDVDDEQGDGDDDVMADDESMPASKKAYELTVATWKILKNEAEKEYSIRALKRIIRLFAFVVHSTDESKGGDQDRFNVSISNSRVFSEVLHFGITRVPLLYRYHLDPDRSLSKNKKNKKLQQQQTSVITDNKTVRPPSITSHNKYTELRTSLQAYIANILHLLNNIIDDNMIRLLLSSLSPVIYLLEPFPKYSLKLIKHLLRLWATQSQNIRIDSFLLLRNLVLNLPHKQGFLEIVLKGIYLTFVRHAKFTSATTLPVIEFMCNSVVELYTIDPVSSYQHAFVYIRQLAIHLRQAIQSTVSNPTQTKAVNGKDKKKAAAAKKSSGSGGGDAYRSVYNWQFVNCLRCWARVLATVGPPSTLSAAAPPHTSLRPLIYPFVEVCMGVLNLAPSTRHHPLRLHIINYLIQLAIKTETYIPLLPSLLTVLHSPELSKRPTQSGKSAMTDIRFILKVSKTAVNSKIFQQQIITHCLASIQRYLTVYCYSIAFPELSLLAVKQLKRFNKTTHIIRLHKSIATLIDKIELSSTWSMQKRRQSDYVPADVVSGKLKVINTFRSTERQPAAVDISPLDRYSQLQQNENMESGGVKDKEAEWKANGNKSSRKNDDNDDDDNVSEDENANDDEDGEHDDDGSTKKSKNTKSRTSKPPSRAVAEQDEDDDGEMILSDDELLDDDDDIIEPMQFSDEDM